MSNIKELSDERDLELKKLGKLYLYLVIVGSLIFLLQKISSPVSMPLNHTIIDLAIFNIQSIFANQDVKKGFIFFLLLFTTYAAIETLVFLRLCLACLYFKYKNNNAVD